MGRYVEFNVSGGNPILVEVEESEVSRHGVVKVGLKDKLQDAGSAAIAIAQTTFEKAIEQVLCPTAQSFIQAIRLMPEPPTEVEINFGLKATGEVGNVAICKAGGESNYTIKVSWKPAKS